VGCELSEGGLQELLPPPVVLILMLLHRLLISITSS
jgi:hypothetical protein